MTTVKAQSPAKINITLHVTGQRDDGYHLLDSLVVFADVGDELTATIGPDLQLTLSGPGTDGVPTDASNLVMRAANALRTARSVEQGAAISLHKYLPVAGGIGGGSSNAATTLKLLAKLWNVDQFPIDAEEVIDLGADVPVCLRGTKPTRMSGIGDVLADIPDLPEAAIVLVNPRIAVPTGFVFEGLLSKTNRAMSPIPEGMDFDAFADWLSHQRNDLQAPAELIAPEIKQTLDKLRTMPQVAFAGMSGSGATCFGLVKNMSDARYVARALQLGFPNWWVAPGKILR